MFSGVAAGFTVVTTSAADVTVFDLMQIEQVIGGVDGDTTAQAVQLRMRAEFQCLMSFTRLWVHDATGANPVLLVDFTTDVAGCRAADRVLITSVNFADFLDGSAPADFTLTNLIPESYLAAGSLTFEDDFGTIYWRLSWGGNAYTGPNDGDCINDDDCPGDFGPPWPGPLPSGGVQALQFQGAAAAESTTNFDDYELTMGAAVFTNNAGQSATVTPPDVCPWDCEVFSDGVVSTADLLALLSQWGSPGSCDFDGGNVSTTDLLALLLNWGRCR